MISKILGSYNKWRNRCRPCEVDGIDKSLIERFNNIKKTSRNKTVTEYVCDKCETLWVLADNARFLNKVTRKELYKKWKSKSCLPTASQKNILSQIIGAPNYNDTDIYFSCAIRLSNEKVVQKVILIATTGDCFGMFPSGHDVKILDSTHEILESDYALPADVRKATMLAREKSMGYSPVNVRDNSGNKYTLSNQMHFFEENGVRGPSVTLDDVPYHSKNIINPDWADMYFICDMFDFKKE